MERVVHNVMNGSNVQTKMKSNVATEDVFQT